MSNLDDDTGYPSDGHGWAELLPGREPTRALVGDHRAAWVVVGAGLTGLACARRLALLHPDQQILLLEARRVGQGASGRNSGFAVATSHFPGALADGQLERCRQVNRINRAGLELLADQVASLDIDCQWRREGFFHTAADSAALAEWQNFRDYLDRFEIEHRALDGDELAALLGSTGYRAGVHVADGALLQPAALVRGLAASLPANVSLFESTPVLSIEAGKPLTLRCPAAEVRTSGAILATNYEAPRLGVLRSRIVGSTLSGSFTRQLTHREIGRLGSLAEWGALSLHSGGATLRLTCDRRISIRNTAEYHGSKLLDDGDLGLRQSIHREAFERRFPQLADVPFEFAWSGVEGISRNATNFFGRQSNNLYYAGGYNGSGISRGTAFGTAIADYASGETSPLVNDCLASPPARWMPPRPLLDLAAWFILRSRFRNVGRDR